MFKLLCALLVISVGLIPNVSHSVLMPKLAVLNLKLSVGSGSDALVTISNVPTDFNQVIKLQGFSEQSYDLPSYGETFQILAGYENSALKLKIVCTDGEGGLSESYDSVSITPVEGQKIDCIVENVVNSKQPVILIPGLGGSELIDENSLLWPNLTELLDPGHNSQLMKRLMFGYNLKPVDGSVKAGNVVGTIGNSIFSFDYSSQWRQYFLDQGYEAGQNLKMFSYDWRSGISDHNIESLKNFVESTITHPDQKVAIIAHSTGGLLLQSAINKYPSLAKAISKVVEIGVPHKGSVKALKSLVAGDSFGIPTLTENITKEFVKNLPVIYQLLPHVLISEGDSVFSTGRYNYLLKLSLTSLDADQVRKKFVDSFASHPFAWVSAEILSKTLSGFEYKNYGIDSLAVVGCGQPTISEMVELSFLPGEHSTEYFFRYGEGDGTLISYSAQSLGKNLHFAKVDHGDMLSNRNILETVGEYLKSSRVMSSGAECKIQGRQFSVFSPVRILAIHKASGLKVGVDSEGRMYKEISGSQVDLLNGQQSVFLPDYSESDYEVKVSAHSDGKFSILSTEYEDSEVSNETFFDSIPVKKGDTGKIFVNQIAVGTGNKSRLYKSKKITFERDSESKRKIKNGLNMRKLIDRLRELLTKYNK